MNWKSETPKADGFYWLRRTGKSDTVVKIYAVKNGLVEFGAMVSWSGSDGDISLCDVIKSKNCMWNGPLSVPVNDQSAHELCYCLDGGPRIVSAMCMRCGGKPFRSCR